MFYCHVNKEKSDEYIKYIIYIYNRFLVAHTDTASDICLFVNDNSVKKQILKIVN